MDRLSRDVGGAELTDYGARLKRSWWAIAIGVLLGLGAGMAFTATQPREYTSTTTVLVTPTGTGSVSLAGGRTGGEINLDTESQLVTSAQVADAARTLLRIEQPVTELLRNVNVTVPPNSQVLNIAYAADSPQEAQQGSHAFAQAYLSHRADEAEKDVAATAATLTAQIDAAREELQAVSDKAAALPSDSPDRVYAEAQRNILINQVTDLSSRLAPLQARTISPGQIITDAPLPRRPTAPVPALNVAAGLMAGLILGLGIAVLADRADHRLRRRGDVVRRLGLPVLADIPGDRNPRRGAPDPMWPGAAHGAVFDRLRNALLGPHPGLRIVHVSDPGARGDSGSVAVNLTRSLARKHGTATLVVAHAGSPVPGWAQAAGRPGLADVLRGEVSLDQVRMSVAGIPGVQLVPPGRDPEELESLLQSPRLAAIVGSLRAGSAPTVVETPGTGQSAAAQAVAAESDAVVLVAARGVADDRAVAAAAEGAAAMGGTVAGVVLTAPTPRRRSSGRLGAVTDTTEPGEPASGPGTPDDPGTAEPARPLPASLTGLTTRRGAAGRGNAVNEPSSR